MNEAGVQVELIESPAEWSRERPIRARARFGAGYPGFDGHFPGKPILPGFLHVQLALDVLSLAGRGAELRAVRAGKFLRAIRPEMEITVELRPGNGAGLVACVLTLEGQAAGGIGGGEASRFELEVGKATGKP